MIADWSMRPTQNEEVAFLGHVVSVQLCAAEDVGTGKHFLHHLLYSILHELKKQRLTTVSADLLCFHSKVDIQAEKTRYAVLKNN